MICFNKFIGFTICFIVFLTFGNLFGSVKQEDTTKAISAEKLIDYISFQSDKIVFNLQGTIPLPPNNIFETLGRLPGILMDNISIIETPSIMVNGRLLQIPAEQIKFYLNGLPTQGVSKIEIIRSPLLKYNGGKSLINIITKNDIKPYLDARYNISYTRNFHHEVGVTYNDTIEKFNYLFSSNFIGGNRFNDNVFKMSYPNGSNTQSFYTEDKTMFSNMRVVLNYDFTPSTSVILEYNGGFGRPKFININNGTLQDAQNVVKNIDTTYSNPLYKNRIDNHAIILVFNTKIGEYTNINIGGDFLNYKTRVKNKKSNKGNIEETYFFQHLNNYNVTLDITTTIIEKFNIEYGANIFQNNAIVDITNVKNTKNTYKENVQAVYMGASMVGPITIKLGARLENTQTYGLLDSLKTDYPKWYPNTTISYLFDKHLITLSYNSRVRRPNFSDLNPFKIYLSKDFYKEGYPSLGPSFFQNIDLSYNGEQWSVGSFFSKSSDNYNQLFFTSNEQKNLTFLGKNFYDQYHYGFLGFYQQTILNRWINISNAKVFGYRSNIHDKVDVKLNDGIAFFVYNKNIFYLDAPKTLYLELVAWYRSAQYDGFYKISDISRIDFGFGYTFTEDWRVAFNYYDILGKSYPFITTDIKGINQQEITLGGYRAKQWNLSVVYNLSDNLFNEMMTGE